MFAITKKRRVSYKHIVGVALVGYSVFTVVAIGLWYLTGMRIPLAITPPVTGQPGIATDAVTESQIDEYRVADDLPRYIKIPELQIDSARVLSVGLIKGNILDVPKNVHDTAWYNQSAKPGSGKGVVVIDGHNQGYSEPGIFKNLGKLTTGSSIVVERGDGKSFRYQVYDVRTLSLEDTSAYGMKELMTPLEAEREGLGLITCAGRYVPIAGEFNQRILVRAVRTDI